MHVQTINQSLDKSLEPYFNIRDSTLACRDNLFVVEGRQNVCRLIEKSSFRIHSLCVTPTAYDALEGSLSLLDTATPVYRVSQETLRRVAGFSIHRGCLALGYRSAKIPQLEFLENLDRKPSRLLILEQVSDPQNIGALFRNARAFGVDAVILCPRTSDPLYRKAIRVSMGASLYLPFLQVEHWPSPLGELRERGYNLIALDPQGKNVSAAGQGGWSQKCALIVGNEGRGLSADARRIADRVLKIDMSDDIDSINVATAAGIILHRIFEAHAIATDKHSQ
jgi:tRNA G18 (ribose-2'-O)-methylase SpoU